MALVVKNLLASAGDRRDVGSILAWEDPLEESMATHSSRIPWTEEPGRLLRSIGSQRVRHDWSDLALMHACMCLGMQRCRETVSGHTARRQLCVIQNDLSEVFLWSQVPLHLKLDFSTHWLCHLPFPSLRFPICRISITIEQIPWNSQEIPWDEGVWNVQHRACKY